MLIGAGEKLGKVLESVKVSKPEIPYVANVTAKYVTEEAEVKPLLIQQVYSSVRWQQSVEAMLAYLCRNRARKNSQRIYEKDCKRRNCR